MTTKSIQSNGALEMKFDEAMRNIYRAAQSECGYTATRFMQMIQTHGGLVTAKRLLASTTFPSGLSQLAECGCLHLSMEALVLDEQWSELFTDAELKLAKRRLT
jgi:hypothetical protein